MFSIAAYPVWKISKAGSYHIHKLLTLKVPAKISSENVVCCMYKLMLMSHVNKNANSVNPDQTAPDLGPHCLSDA